MIKCTGKISLFFLLFILFFIRCPAFCQGSGLTKEKAVQIACDAFQKLGGKLNERVIIYDVNNGQWERKLETISNAEFAKKLGSLEEKDYQAICFVPKPKPGISGTKTWVFVDRENGKVLAVYSEE